jgi:hypothetical protein
MHTSLILAVTFVPLVLVIALIVLLITWLRRRRVNHSDVVDLVALHKESLKHVAADEAVEGRKSVEPFPQLPSMDLHDTGGLLSTSYYENLPTLPIDNVGLTQPNIHSTPSDRTSLVESPSREALAAFNFSNTPSKPPLPARSLKRVSGSNQPSPNATPAIKIEPASPRASEAEDKIQPLIFPKTRLSPDIPSRGSSRIPENTKSENIKPIPFSAVPIAHIGSPISDDLPPTPTRASAYLHKPIMPKDDEGMQAMMKNREMMEMEGWRPDRARAEGIASRQGLMKKKSGVNMHGKRNSAILEYVRNFPEQNPWRKMMAGRNKDVHVEEGRGEQEFTQKFGGGRWE